MYTARAGTNDAEPTFRITKRRMAKNHPKTNTKEC